MFLLCICVIVVSSVSAKTKLSITSISDQEINYDSDTSNNVLSTTFTLQLTGGFFWPVTYYIVIDELSSSASERNLAAASNSGSSLTGTFYLYNSDDGSTQEIPSSQKISSAASVTLYPDFWGDATQQLTLNFPITQGQIVPGDTYSGIFQLKIYKNTKSSSNPSCSSRSFTYKATVIKTVDVKLGSATGSYGSGQSSLNIDLDEVSQGASTNFGIFVKGNSAYTLSMKDASGGYLTSTTTSDKISYTLTIDGINYPLSTSDTEILHQSTNAMYNNVYIGAINVPAGQDVEAGQYSDTISFSVTAN